jgi:hypothetical protein
MMALQTATTAALLTPKKQHQGYADAAHQTLIATTMVPQIAWMNARLIL